MGPAGPLQGRGLKALRDDVRASAPPPHACTHLYTRTPTLTTPLHSPPPKHTRPQVNMLAREYCDDIKRKLKPIILSHRWGRELGCSWRGRRAL